MIKEKFEHYVEVKVSTIKQAGKGVFATKEFKKGDVIGIFYGKPTNVDGKHVLWLSNKEGIVVNNFLKYVNHSKKGNAELYGTILYAMKKIKKGEEIFFDYNPDVENVFK